MAPKKSTTKRRSTNIRRKRLTLRKNVLNMRKTDNYATIEETFSMQAVAGQTFNSKVQMAIDFVRAQVLAKAYQYYRITKVVMKFKPLFDTFSTLGPSTVPQLYFVYDRSNTLPALTAPQFEQLGVKAIRFDDKYIVKSHKPAVIGESSGNLPAQYKVSPWLPCNTNSTGGFVVSAVDHFGTCFLITKMYPTDATIYDIDVVCTVQFKSPLVPGTSSIEKVNPPRGNVEYGVKNDISGNQLNI